MDDFFSVIWNFLYNIMSVVIRVFVAPLNVLIINIFPDLSSTISEMITNFLELLNHLNWATGIIPASTLKLLLLILAIESCKYTIVYSTRGIRLIFKISSSLHNKLGAFIKI